MSDHLLSGTLSLANAVHKHTKIPKTFKKSAHRYVLSSFGLVVLAVPALSLGVLGFVCFIVLAVIFGILCLVFLIMFAPLLGDLVPVDLTVPSPLLGDLVLVGLAVPALGFGILVLAFRLCHVRTIPEILYYSDCF